MLFGLTARILVCSLAIQPPLQVPIAGLANHYRVVCLTPGGRGNLMARWEKQLLQLIKAQK